MNTGIVSVRYARALLRYVQELGCGEHVCREACALLADPDSVTSVQLSAELGRFANLLKRQGRLQDVRQILNTFVRMYRESTGTLMAKLTTCAPAPELEQRLRPILEERFGLKVEMEVSVDERLLGGFKVDVGDYELDASLRSQIEALRRQFVVRNNRIV